ncbi:hypothetical protein [Gilvimarinus xylanilyticus]|uniref:C-type lysozyme inhibitor domain-containing protein n=1 Tax=Gilvimarinus xylanilyticus TaxID=2944139 RepID=A0A9X2KUW3_9GAMM|nr:hypothetical protein [Gilvimarinus xylanilyticus]MCP8900809.1 hypothetical protein [Gilvimarinus xylanilyticus]
MIARLVVLCAALCACQNLPGARQPAVLLAPSAQTQQELTQAVSNALNTRVRLSPQALVKTSDLTIDAPAPKRLENQGGAGLILGRPDHFSLWLQNGQCILQHQESGQEWILKTARCAEL